MKNNLQILLAGMLAFSAGYLSADGRTTNNTFLTPRSQGVNLALEKTQAWPSLVCRHDEDAFGGNFQATFFMSGSTEKEALAKYFLFSGKSGIKLPADAAANTVGGTNGDLDLGFLIHNQALTQATTDTTFGLAPEQKVIGATFTYHQDLKKLVDGMYLSLSVPLANVQNSMRPTAAGTQNAELLKFFQGTRAGAEPADAEVNAYTNLTAAKISSCTRSQTGVADVQLALGYKAIEMERFYLDLNFGITIPTGNIPDGEYAFDAVVGNNGHLGLGFGLGAGAKLWKSEDCNHNLRLNFAMNYRYLLENDEVRTLGFTNQNFGQYMLLINRTEAPAAQQLTPAANVTTVNVDVTGQSQFDGILALAYNYCGFSFDLGYNLFYRDAEKVKLANKTDFVDNTWGIATRNADMTQTPNGADNTNPVSNTNLLTNTAYVYRSVNTADLDLAGAQTPSLLSHKIYGGVAYWTKGWEVPVLVGAGAHYEWADADIISNWGFNARFGVGF